ncbi:hypothetical protein DSO57_1001466 [Entomophthora muscae]|uniref:Uncharacterized protein n=1 Tax=Entomophthora muscae TaxID=34485 RepID=A0ACC2UIL4_9FUNG|nr:hypothetical protein DSO57_1001466 [Entomophthora muscae]
MKFAVLSYFMLAASAAINCGCKEGDVKCIADCTKTPNPTNDMAEKTNDCNTRCTLSGGGDDCFSSCVSQNYLANQPNAPTPITSSTTTPTSTTSSTTASSKEDETKTADSDKDDATKPKPTDADKSKTTDADKPKPTDTTKSKSTDSDKDDKSSSKKSSSSGPSKSVPASDTAADSHATLPAVGSIMALALPALHYLI